MKFAFAHMPTNVELSARLVERAEALGFDQAWVPDQQLFLDPYVCLSVMALRTSSIKLGVGVTNPFTRHPAISARAISSVNEIAAGRAVLGIGAGNMKELVQPLHLDAGAVAAKCREAALISRDLTKGGAVNFQGSYFQVEGIGFDVPPYGQVPVYLAGRGPKILEAAGEVGDGAIIGSLASPAGLRYAIGRIRAGAEAAGRALTELDIVSWTTVHITDHVAEALDGLRVSIGHLMGGAPPEVLRILGFDDEFIPRLKAAYQSGGPKGAAPLVTDEAIGHFTLVGSPEMIAERVAALAEIGVTQLSLLMPPGNTEDHASVLEAFCTKVRPQLPAGVR